MKEISSKKKRITVLMGAGAMVEATGVDTDLITKKVIEACKGYTICNGKNILESFSEEFKSRLSVDKRDANFEELFDMIESVVDFQRKSYNNSSASILAKLKIQYRGLGKNIFGLKRTFLETINSIIGEYDAQYEEKSEWMKSFFDSFIKNENCLLDVFNLNYDNWMECILEDYNDGYEEIPSYNFKRFNAQKYMNNYNNHTISHIHGQICFEEASFEEKDIGMYDFEEQGYTLYKYPTFEGANNYRRRHVRSDDISQSGHNIFLSNIITGRMKMDKLLWSPMQIYIYGLMRALFENDEIIIIGYGFGDLYINSLLMKFLSIHSRKHITIVSYVKDEEYTSNVASYGAPFGIHEENVFVKCAMNKEVITKHINKPENGTIASDNDETKIYLNGFKDFATRYVRECGNG